MADAVDPGLCTVRMCLYGANALRIVSAKPGRGESRDARQSSARKRAVEWRVLA
jgi:hypothetical protein